MSFLTKLGSYRLFNYAKRIKVKKNSNYVISFRSDNWHYIKSSFSPFKYLLLFTTGYITAKVIKKETTFLSVASATSNLSGRKKQFNFVSDVVKKCGPGVVYIEIRDNRNYDFFTGIPKAISNGSGFIIKEDGLILTNAHVVANQPRSQVVVKLHNGTTYMGQVEDLDVNSDLATIRISAKNLPVIPLGNSSELEPGEFVVAIGSPLSLSNSVSFGVISSTHRGSDELGLKGRDMVYLQTDAAITFGNSGGPLVDLEGNAIGISSMKVAAGISFAIPSDYAKAFLKGTEGTKKIGKSVAKKYMGITMLTLSPQIIHELQEKYQIVPSDVKNGVLVWKVILESPAHKGGLQPGDIVTHIDGKPVQGASDVYSIISNTQVKTVAVSINRHGKKFDLYVTPENID